MKMIKQDCLILSPYIALYDIVVPKNHLLRELSDLVDFSFVDNMLKDKYFYIFKHYKDRKFKCTVNPFEYIDHYSEMSLRDTRWNKYVLRYLLSDEEKIKTMSNFAFMGDPEKRVQLMKAYLQHIENQE